MIKEVSITDLFKMRWEDLTLKEMIKIIELSDILYSLEKSSIEYGLTVINILRVLRKNKSLVSKAMVNESVALDCFNDITFFQRNPDGSFKTPWLFFPVGNFWSNGVEFQRPDLHGSLPMYNRSFDQLVWADTAFSSFCVLNYQLLKEDLSESQKRQVQQDMNDAINNLVAVLYHPQKGFEVEKMEVHARLVNMKSIAERSLILHTYANVRTFITERCQYLFPGVGDSHTQAPVNTGPMWLNLRYDLAETNVFRGFDTARQASIYDALDYLDKKEYEAIQRKENDKG